jgi:FkbM family methyltransferase
MKFTVPTDDGTELSLECPETLAERWVCEAVLRGRTYPYIPFAGEVATVVDVGANAGATSVFFAHHYPDAQIHSVEPGSEILEYLRRNVADLPNVTVHPIGLHAEDQVATLYRGYDLSLSSLFEREVNSDQSEQIQIRAAGPWAAEQGLTSIDVLKVDVEGCEVEVLESLGALLPTVKVLYVEYDSRVARRSIDALLADTHELYIGLTFLDQGEIVYLRKDLVVDGAVARAHLRELWRRDQEAAAAAKA